MSDLLGRKGPLRGSQVSRRRARASPQGPERAQARGTAPQHGSEGARALCREQGRGGLTQPPARPVETNLSSNAPFTSEHLVQTRSSTASDLSPHLL